MSVDTEVYEFAQRWFERARSQRGYSKEEVNELAEAIQGECENAVMDDEDDL